MQQERKIQYGASSSTTTMVEDGTCKVNAVEWQRQFGSERGRGNNNSYAGRGWGNMKVYTYCEKTCHIIDSCYKKHGYPPNFGRGNSYVNQVKGEDGEEKSKMGSTSGNRSMTLTKDQY